MNRASGGRCPSRRVPATADTPAAHARRETGRVPGPTRVLGLVLSFVLGLVADPAAAVVGGRMEASDLAGLSLEQLADVVVTSVSRREEPLSHAAASIYVISREDIRRSGATSLPEALRLAPNLDVARADANQYAISARGFDNVLANRMLVLIDGRTVYTPLFSGVFWEAQDVMLDDVERIEVISGPGSTLWGVNAVNGVINVITRTARDTQGDLVSAGIGNKESGLAARHGGTLGPDAWYRFYARYVDRDHTAFAGGTPIRDASYHRQGGFRADWTPPGRRLTLQGDAYDASIDQLPQARTISGGNLLARYVRDFGDSRKLTLQAYYDATRRDHPLTFHEALDTLDVEAQYAFVPAARHQLLVGGGYRYARDRVRNSASQAFLPPDRSLDWGQVFAQDEIVLTPTLDLVVGAKVETNVYTGSEFLPNVRLAWRAGERRLLWVALSRAVRAPSRFDRELYVPGTEPHVQLAGGPDFRSEVANVAEIGYRSAPWSGFTYSLTAFHHDHTKLRSVEPVPGSFVFANRIAGTTSGIEGWTSYQVAPWWRVTAGGVALRQRLHREPDSRDPGFGLPALGNDPPAWWTMRSSFTFGTYEADVAVRHVASRPSPDVPAYTTVDARLGWNLRRDLGIALTLQNLTDPEHPEWGPAINRSEIRRTLFFSVRWTP